MRRVMVAGAGGGIGLALVNALAARADVEQVYALHRHPVSSIDPRVTWLEADLRDPQSLHAAMDRVAGPLCGLIIATGVLHGPDALPEKSLDELDPQRLLDLYAINAVGPLMLLQAARDRLLEGKAACVCFLSAQVGSIGDNRSGGWYGYRMAKAALNMAVKCASIELGRASNPPIVVAVHPGTTRTALSSRFVRRRKQPVSTPQVAASRLIALLENLKPAQSGTFLNYDGSRLPW